MTPDKQALMHVLEHYAFTHIRGPEFEGFSVMSLPVKVLTTKICQEDAVVFKCWSYTKMPGGGYVIRTVWRSPQGVPQYIEGDSPWTFVVPTEALARILIIELDASHAPTPKILTPHILSVLQHSIDTALSCPCPICWGCMLPPPQGLGAHITKIRLIDFYLGMGKNITVELAEVKIQKAIKNRNAPAKGITKVRTRIRYKRPQPVDYEAAEPPIPMDPPDYDELKPEDYTQPWELPNKVAFEFWGLPKLSLPREAADFYVLEYLHSVCDYEPAADIMQVKIGILADAFSRYLCMAIGGEFRHVLRLNRSGLPDKVEKYYPHAGKDGDSTPHRSNAWIGWKHLYDKYGSIVVKVAADAFNGKDGVDWEGSFGGAAWGMIADVLYKFMTGKMKPKIFVDLIWSMEHNGGTVFDKAAGWFLGTSALRDVLNAQRAGDVEKLVACCSPRVQSLHKGWKNGQA